MTSRRGLDSTGTYPDLVAALAMIDVETAVLDGEIVEQGTVADLFNRPQHPYTRGLVATARLDQIEPGERLPTVEDFHARRP